MFSFLEFEWGNMSTDGYHAVVLITYITLIFMSLLSLAALYGGIRGINKKSYLYGQNVYIYVLFCSVLIVFYAGAYLLLGVHIDDQRVTDGYTALYFSTVTWTTLGFGDIQPERDARMLAAFQALFGQIYMASLIVMMVHALGLENKKAAPNNDKK
jgi:hypothetical protein